MTTVADPTPLFQIYRCKSEQLRLTCSVLHRNPTHHAAYPSQQSLYRCWLSVSVSKCDCESESYSCTHTHTHKKCKSVQDKTDTKELRNPRAKVADLKLICKFDQHWSRTLPSCSQPKCLKCIGSHAYPRSDGWNMTANHWSTHHPDATFASPCFELQN